MTTFVKQRPDAPRGFFAVEAAGLAWLGEARQDGGVEVVQPLEPVGPEATRITLPRLVPGTPDAGPRAAAEDFGRRLASTHRAGGDWFGCPPPAWDGDGFIGPIPLLHNRSDPTASWGSFFARDRIAPFARSAHESGSLSGQGRQVLDRLCERLTDGDADLCGPPEPVARLHGDLWSGNVIWTVDGAVLIDPAAHGGHRESDLAMLALFGLPHLDTVLAAYDEAYPLADGWRDRVGVHQLFPLLVHAVLFGSGYGAQAAATAARY